MAEELDYQDDDNKGDSVTSREQLRQAVQSDVDAFLARGGQIQKIDNNVMADPPRKPQSSYGSRPI